MLEDKEMWRIKHIRPVHHRHITETSPLVTKSSFVLDSPVETIHRKTEVRDEKGGSVLSMFQYVFDYLLVDVYSFDFLSDRMLNGVNL